MDFIKRVTELIFQLLSQMLNEARSSFWESVSRLWNNILEKFHLLVEKISQQLSYLSQQLEERLLSLIEELRPVWEDPLWQVIMLLFATVSILLLSWWLLVNGQRLLIKLVSFIWFGLTWLAGKMIKPFVWSYRWLSNNRLKVPQKPDWHILRHLQVRKSVEALRYITTQRDWRYKTPWYLLIGEPESGKSSLVESVTQGRRAQLLLREKQLETPGSRWHFFDHGVVIDADGHLAAGSDNNSVDEHLVDKHSTDKDSATGNIVNKNTTRQQSESHESESGFELETETDEQLPGEPGVSPAKNNVGNKLHELSSRFNLEKFKPDNSKSEKLQSYKYLLKLLHLYRPERPVDGVILTVSAKSLLSAKTPADQQKLGEQLYQRLWLLQKQTGYVTPVYMVVTGCDDVTGFRAFWRAQPDSRYQEMQGWSNPNRLDAAFSPEWIEQAFTQVTGNLQEAQFQAAASGETIKDIDNFMLFHRYFLALKKPLKAVIASAFSRSRYQEPLPLRGVYFSGKVKKDIVFTDDLMSRKIFAETNLAWPLEKRLFSTQKTLRRFQISTVAIAIMLFSLMLVDSVRLSQNVTQSQRVLGRLIPVESAVSPQLTTNTITHKCSAQGLESYRLLAHLSEIGDQRFYLSLPTSWLDPKLLQQQIKVAEKILKPILFAKLECRIKAKAVEINSQVWSGGSDISYPVVIKQLSRYSQMIDDYHTSRSNFLYLAGPLANDRKVGKRLAELLQYLYDSPIPDSVNLSSPLITGAIQVMDYDVDWDEGQANLVAEHEVLADLKQITSKLHSNLMAHAQEPPLEDLQSLITASTNVPLNQPISASPLMPEIDNFQNWLALIERDWLASKRNSPCQQVYRQLIALKKSLIQVGYPDERLDEIVTPFDKTNCDEAVHSGLVNLTEYPFGKLFVIDELNTITLAPALSQIRRQLKTIETLTFLKGTYPPIINSTESVVGWRITPLHDALEILVEFQKFALENWAEKEPFYAPMLRRRLRQVIERLFNQSLVRRSQTISFNSSSRIDHEGDLSQQIDSFNQVQSVLLRLSSLLQQTGDTYNRLSLLQVSRSFVDSQFQQLDSLVANNQLYKPVLNPHWPDNDYARALFNNETDKQLDDYLSGQRQRFSYLAYNYAEPLLGYLLNTGGLAPGSKKSNRWLSTLTALNQYRRDEPNNPIQTLETFINAKLVSLNDLNCQQWLLERGNGKSGESGQFDYGSSWFGERHFQVERQVSFHCQGYGKHQVIGRYLEIAERFNQDIAGRFPFAEVSNAGVNELTPVQLQQFFQFYDQRSEGLLPELDKLAVAKPQLVARSWQDFIRQLNQFNQFLKQTTDAGKPDWNIPLNVTFHALSHQSPGADQIIDWRLSNGNQQISFPNGGSLTNWRVGEALQLALRWANGSAYQPVLPLVKTPRVKVLLDKSLTTFTSRGRWGLFEWLSLYSGTSKDDFQTQQQGDQLLTFKVPVALRTDIFSEPEAAYVAHANLLMRSDYIKQDGKTATLQLPSALPYFAPGFSD